MDSPGALTITAPGPPGSLKRHLCIDGHPCLTTSRDVVRALELEDGEPVTCAELGMRVKTEEPTWAHQRTLRLLNHRDRSQAEVSRRLREDGYSATTVEQVLDRFVELGFLDDERFAAGLVRSKVLAGWGPHRIRGALRAAGVDDTVLERAMSAECPVRDLERAREIAARFTPHDRASAARLANRLIRRGFDVSTARTVAFERLADADVPPLDSV